MAAKRTLYPDEHRHALDFSEDTYDEKYDGSPLSHEGQTPTADHIHMNGQWYTDNTIKNSRPKTIHGMSHEKPRDTGKKQLFGSLPSLDDREPRQARGHPNFPTLRRRSSSVESAALMQPPDTAHPSQQTRARARARDYLQETEDDDEIPAKRKRLVPRTFKAHPSHASHRAADGFMSQETTRSASPTYSQLDLATSTSIDETPVHHLHPSTTQPRRPASPDDDDHDDDDDDDDSSGLFVTGHTPSPLTDPTDTPPHRARLRALASNPGAHPYARRRAPETDPENRLIKTLRQHQRLHWDEIAARLNRERVAAGKAPSFTTAAVYGRFQRVAPRIAEAEGEAGFDYREFLHFKHGRREGGGRGRSSPAMPRLGEGEVEVLARCYEEVERERWENVARKFKLRAGLQLSAEQVARKWNTL